MELNVNQAAMDEYFAVREAIHLINSRPRMDESYAIKLYAADIIRKQFRKDMAFFDKAILRYLAKGATE